MCVIVGGVSSPAVLDLVPVVCEGEPKYALLEQGTRALPDGDALSRAASPLNNNVSCTLQQDDRFAPRIFGVGDNVADFSSKVGTRFPTSFLLEDSHSSKGVSLSDLFPQDLRSSKGVSSSSEFVSSALFLAVRCCACFVPVRLLPYKTCEYNELRSLFLEIDSLLSQSET